MVSLFTIRFNSFIKTGEDWFLGNKTNPSYYNIFSPNYCSLFVLRLQFYRSKFLQY